MAQRVGKKSTSRSRIAQVRFFNYIGSTPEEIFREGFERAQAGFSLSTVVRFFDRRNILANAVSSHGRMCEQYDLLVRSLKKAQDVKKPDKAHVKRLTREIKTVGTSVVNSRKRIHDSALKELEGIVRDRGLLAFEDEETGRTRMLALEEFFDLLSRAKLARHMCVEIFAPTYLLCRRENLTVYASME